MKQKYKPSFVQVAGHHFIYRNGTTNFCTKLDTSIHTVEDQPKNAHFMLKKVEKALYLVVHVTFVTEANFSSKVIFLFCHFLFSPLLLCITRIMSVKIYV